MIDKCGGVPSFFVNEQSGDHPFPTFLLEVHSIEQWAAYAVFAIPVTTGDQMSAFEALFAFYGLLLGLAIAAVATGFGEQWRRRRLRPIGSLAPLLGLYVLLAATRQWQNFYLARDALTMTPVTLFMCLGMALPYTFVAQVMFPASDDAVKDGDAHYLADRRILLGVLMIPPAISLSFNLIVNPKFLRTDIASDILSQPVPLIVLAALIPLGRRSWQIAGLLALVLDRLVVIIV